VYRRSTTFSVVANGGRSARISLLMFVSLERD
jgi:hypothetical protein